MEDIKVCLLYERISWRAIAERVPDQQILLDRAKDFGKYTASMLIALIAASIDCDPISLADKIISIACLKGLNEKIYKIQLSSLDDFDSDFTTEDCNYVYLVTESKGRYSIKTMLSYCVEQDVRTFQLVGKSRVHGFEVWSNTHGGSIYSLLHNSDTWKERENDKSGNLVRFSRGLFDNLSNLTSARDAHEFFDLSVMDSFEVKRSKKDKFLDRCDQGNIGTLYPWLNGNQESTNFLAFLNTVRLSCQNYWEEISSTVDESLRVQKRKREDEEEELDFSTFPLTYRFSFQLKDSKAVVAVLQRWFLEFISRFLICATNGQMWEKINRNGIEYQTINYMAEVTIEDLAINFLNHIRHLIDKCNVDTCIFCRYDWGKNLHGYPEFYPFFEKAMQCTPCKKTFTDMRGDNEGRILDKSLVAFQNVYFDTVRLEFIPLSHIDNYGKIAVCNHTDKAIPDDLLNDEEMLKSLTLFEDFKHLIPVFCACLGQDNDVTKVLLADLGSSFLERGVYDFFQKGSFILGQGGKGKSEFQKIIRLIHGKWNCITPCQNTFGQKFSHSQYTGSLKVAFLPDEINKDCALSQQQWYNWCDQTDIQCEIKYKQALKNSPFLLYILWVANSFFPKFELSEALLRRALVFDVNFFTFQKFSRSPSSLVGSTEVRLL